MGASYTAQAGDAIGRWTVVKDGAGHIQQSGRRLRTVICRCSCGVERELLAQSLGRNSRSCGCLQVELAASQNLTHGHARESGNSPEYGVWGRLVETRRLPKRWAKGDGDLSAFECFLSDIGHRPGSGYVLARKHEGAGERPDDFEWVTRAESVRRQRPPGPVSRSGVRGVSRHTTLDAWMARIMVCGKLIYLGVYKELEAAAAARRAAEQKYGRT